jgi:hypothetical protein
MRRFATQVEAQNGCSFLEIAKAKHKRNTLFRSETRKRVFGVKPTGGLTLIFTGESVVAAGSRSVWASRHRRQLAWA